MFTKRIQLHDGTAAVIRPAKPQDAALIEAMYERVSDESFHRYYMGLYKPGAEDARRIAEITPEKGAALVLTIENPEETVVGYAFYIIENGQQTPTAEPGILIEDSVQGRGVGRLLWQSMSHYAQARGIRILHVYTHPANDAMIHIMRKSEFPFKAEAEFGTLEAHIQLDPAA